MSGEPPAENLDIDLQIACGAENFLPSETQLESWVTHCLRTLNATSTLELNPNLATEVSIRIVEEQEIQDLNARFRHKNKPTNVLSFPGECSADVPLQLLGDIVLCASVIAAEAKAQQKTTESHWAHMIIHGMLHLLGYDHLEDTEAEQMEALETHILNQLGYSNPYQEQVVQPHRTNLQ